MTENGYNVQIQVRNNHLLKRIRNQYGSSAKMCKETGLVATAVSALLCFREKPFLMDGSLSTVAAGLCSALGATPEELWPDEMSEIVAKKGNVRAGAQPSRSAVPLQQRRRRHHREAVHRKVVRVFERQATDSIRVPCWGHNTRSSWQRDWGAL
jgi:hypothetical protein